MTTALVVKRALVIGAHADDVEFTSAGTVARWTSEGAVVGYVLCTDSSRGTDDPRLPPRELARIRQKEQRAAALKVGVRECWFLGYEDGTLEPTLALRRDLVRAIRSFRPDTVICPDPTVRWHGQGYLNHPDHLAVADAALAAIYPSARDRWAFPELLAEGLEPHKVGTVLLSAPAEPDTWVDISATIDLKVAALLEHKSQITDPGAVEFVRDWGRRAGVAQGLPYAEAFRAFFLG
ncbi:MAG: PIG-L family deacetylase [Chloroflexi bacterium]|nr:PIG-L family deacetylase [Chloroflexota bacterium]